MHRLELHPEANVTFRSSAAVILVYFNRQSISPLQNTADGGECCLKFPIVAYDDDFVAAPHRTLFRVTNNSATENATFYLHMRACRWLRSADADHGRLAAAFEAIAKSRVAQGKFDANRPVSDDILRKVLELTQSSPSSFNLQPYKIILVQSAKMREALAGTMLGGNAEKVRAAPITAVFAADKEPSRLVRKLMDLELQHGADEASVASLPTRISFLFGQGWLSQKLRMTATHLLSPLIPSPVIAPSMDAWAAKNAAFAAQTYMFAATAYGLATAPMEGFDERRVGFVLDIPAERYIVPLVVCTGYARSEATQQGEGKDPSNIHSQDLANSPNSAFGKRKPKPRFPMADVVCYDTFRIPFR